uniref:Diacylglycerol O-acyltransferase n=1 Tax=Kalanchoe fedtschenkoi TaxID=63787 RepID=A0A7N0U0U7_KALFE
MKPIKTKTSNTDLLGFPSAAELGDDAEPVIDEKDNGRLKWVKTLVDLEDHVITPNVCANEDTKPEKIIEKYVLKLTETPLDKSKPLWDLHLINLRTSDAESVAIFRVHHSLGDGMSLVSLLLACTRQTANPDALPTIPALRKAKKQRGFGSFLMILFNTIVDVFRFILTALFLKDTQTPLRSPPGVEFTARRIVHRTVSLDDMKLIKNHLSATINDVALGVTQAGISRYLNRKYGELKKESVGSTEERNNLAKNIRFRTALLINLRPAGIKKMAEMMEKNSDAKYGNGIGFVLLPINIALRDDPLEYVREAKATVDRKKNSLEAIWNSTIVDAIPKLFGTERASKLSHTAVRHTTGSFSNLVGPLEEVSFYGHPIAFLAPGCYGLPQGLMINFQSYVNKMTMVLSVDETTVPDPDKLCDDIEESLELVKKAVMAAIMK